MNIVTALEALAVEGLEGDHDHVIETVLSKLFLRGNEVHKAYKHRTADIDLADKETRRRYISEDFFWNNVMAPEIYLELRHVVLKNDRFVHTGPDVADDWYIVMRRIDTEKDLLRRLRDAHPSEEELAKYATILASRLRTLTEARGEDLAEHMKKGASHVKSEVLGVIAWARTASPHLNEADIERARTLLARALDTHEYFQQDLDLSVVIDTNPENIIFLDEGVSFIDVMPPKDEWRVHDPYFALCRTSADVAALGDETKSEALHDAYAREAELPSPVVRDVYELAAALIQTPYRKMVGRLDLAERYAEFSRKKMDRLEEALRCDI